MKREIINHLIQLITDSKSHEVLIIEGARQVGKSYLVEDALKQVKRKVHSYDLEKESKLRRKINHTEDFIDFKTLMTDQYKVKNNSILFLDEAQESPKLAEYIKSFKEDWPEIKVILTGSSMNRLYSRGKRIPVGRTKSLCIFPFSFLEFIKFTGEKNLYEFIKSAPGKVPLSRHKYLLELFDIYMQIGGYPEAIKAYKQKKSYIEIINEIMGSLSEDFERKEAFEPALFNNTIKAVSNHIGSSSKLTQFDTTKYNAVKVIEALKSWHILIEVAQTTLNPFKSKLLPKRYMHDLGVVNRFRSLAAPTISILNTIDEKLRTPLGGLFENAVLLNILEGHSIYKNISGWKKGNNTDIEVDFLIEAGSKGKNKIPIECKAAIELKSKHYTNVLHYLRETGQKTGIVVSAAPLEIKKLKNKIKIINIPVYLATRDNIIQYL